MRLFSLDGDVALVTGAGSGIGQAIAIGLAEAGAKVALFDLARQAAGLEETLANIERRGGKGLIAHGDVTAELDLAQAVEATERELGALSVAVNAAGIAAATPAEDTTRDEWGRIIDVNTRKTLVVGEDEGLLKQLFRGIQSTTSGPMLGRRL